MQMELTRKYEGENGPKRTAKVRDDGTDPVNR